MYQQPMPRDEREWQGSSYVPPGTNPEYNQGYRGDPQDKDQLAEAIAQRLRAEFHLGLQPSTHPSAGQRLALAIVSLVLLVPLVSIIFAAAGAFGGLIGLGVICLAVVLVNLVFNRNS